MKTNSIWYERPAERWKECIPMGNGSMGAMIYGTVGEEHLNLNEESVWADPAKDYHNPKAQEALPKLRQLLFEGELARAQQLARECFVSVPRKFGAFWPCADLVIGENDATHAGEEAAPKYCDYTNYRRELDMETGIISVDYDKMDIHFHREYFASCPDRVMVIRYDCSEDIPLDYSIQFWDGAWNCGSCSETKDVIYHTEQLADDGIRYYAAAKAVACSGSGRVQNNKLFSDLGYTKPSLDVSHSASFVVYLAITTDYADRDPAACFDIIEKAAEKGYDKVKADHIRDYSSHYHRFGLELGERDDEDIPLAQWLDRVRSGDISPAFAELYMNYTRYMLISASRAKGLPSNLQGLWNVWKEQTWESDYHTNINMQMNYWPAQAWGLSDCEEPLADWLELLAKTGAQSARRNYQAGGWTVHHCSNPFGYAQPNFDVVGLWPMGGPWMSRHLYEMWAYGRDYEQMRKRLYPIIRGSAEFILDFLVEAPEGTACPGCLVTNPSVSPENEYYLADGSRGMLTYGCTMDIQIIRDLFDNILELIEEIQMREPGFDAALAQRIREASARLPEIKISSKGNIQEWIEDYEEVDPGHRHMSHLYGVYPGRTICPETSPELADAARRTIERKYEAGYDGQGWSMGWQACIRARLGDGEPAYQVLCENFRRHILPNLMINSHGVAQVGDAFGIPAAMFEMLVQSHEGRIVLLPAIPKAWHCGRVTGLRVRQNHSVDMEWKDGQVVHALICHGKDAKDMPVVLKNPENYEIVHTGEATEITLKK